MKKPLTLKQQKALYIRARHVYYTDPDGKTLMSDAQFDALERSIASQAPNWHVLQSTGHTKKIDTPLLAPMPSLSKIYNWPGTTNKGYLTTPKFDGTSLQLVYVNGRPHSLLTRGNGMIGGDVSFILPYLKIPKRIPHKGTVIFRCEGIMERSKFEKRWKKPANPDGYSMARAAVNGQFNRTVDELDLDLLADTDLIVVGVYGQRCDKMYDFARACGFRVAPALKLDVLTQEVLVGMVERLRKTFPYDTDGLVLTMRHLIYEFEDASLPGFAHAFKQNQEGVRTTVRKIIWQISRYKRWTPVIIVDEVDFDGYRTTRATAHTAEWMMSRGVGVGAEVILIRGGEIIPKIERVVKRAKFFTPPPGKVEWRGVHLYASEQNGVASRQAQNIAIEHFITALGIKDISEKGIDALMEKGIKSVLDLLKLAKHEQGLNRLRFLFGANGVKLHARLTKLLKDGVPLITMAASSGAMPPGVGREKLESISKVMPLKNLLTEEPQALFETILKVHGIAEISARKIVMGCKELRIMARQYRKAGIKLILEQAKPKATSDKYADVVAAWTGYRSEEQEAAITAGGGTVGSLTKKTTHLFYNPAGKFLEKVEKARKEGKKVMTWEEFVK